ncbi:MAG: sigma-70 family RNA polymerase sigma factor [Gemmataceae bacterium]|nr:sigma-70 family RNA polymerase sigma factor [Gemmataceae bacterium]
MPTLKTSLLSHLHRLMPADADWLARFVANRDEDAFAHLVSRHGPMVLRLCRRLVGDAHLAEDCFQATFLALARQAASIRRPGALAAWLYGVAHRVAAKARQEHSRRETLGSEAVAECPDPRPHTLDRLTGRELMLVFEMELQRLPESYRLPILLCCVQGLSLEEAAGCLGWTAGSVKGRLERGRARLHARLKRRGLTLALGLSAIEAARGLAANTLAPCLANSTVRAGLAFARGSSTGISAEAVRLAMDLIGSAWPRRMLTWMCMLGVGFAALGAAALSRPAVNDGPFEGAGPPAFHDRPDEAAGKPEGAGDVHARENLPPGARFRIGSTRLQHGSSIYAVAAAPDGKLLASVSGDGDLSMWEMPTGRERYRKSVGPPSASFLAFTPDAKSLILNQKSKLCLLDVETGQISKQLGASAAAGVFSTDGKVLTVVGGTIRRLDFATGKTLSEWQFHKEPPPGFVGGLGGGMASLEGRLSADGMLVAMLETYHFNNTKQTLRVHEVASGKELYRLNLSAPWVRDVAFVGDNKFVVTGSTNSTLRVWELATGKAVREWKPDPRQNVEYSRIHVLTMPDGQSILAQGPDGLMRWDWRTGKKLHSYFDSTGPIAFLGGGKAMAVQGWQTVSSLWVLDTATGKNVCPLPRPGHRVAYSPDSRLIAWSEADALVVADAALGKEIRRWPAHKGGVAPFTFAADGKTLASAGGDNRIRLWNLDTVTEIRSMEQSGVSRLAYSADGKRLAAVLYWHEEIRLWDPATGQQLGQWHAKGLATLDPGGRVAAVGDRKHKVLRLVDLAKGMEVHVLPGYQDRIGHQYQTKNQKGGSHGDFPPLFSPDGRLLLAGAEAPEEGPDDDSLKNGVVHFWDVASGKRLPPRISGRKFIDDRYLAFSPDSRLLAIMRSDCTICLMDTATGEVVRTLGQAEDRMTAPAVFTPDGRVLVTAVGHLVQLWEVATGGELTSRRGHRGNVDLLVMSGNGRSVATVSRDHTILVWDLTRFSTGALPKAPLTPVQLESAWTDLTSSNAVAGRRAVETLCADPAQAAPLLRERLAPIKSPDSKQVARWIADLSNDVFEKRQLASDNLERLGELAGPALRTALAAEPPLEARRRMTALLAKLSPAVLPPEALRGVQVLEMIANPEARKVLAVLAGGAAGARLTQEAQASLERLAQ